MPKPHPKNRAEKFGGLVAAENVPSVPNAGPPIAPDARVQIVLLVAAGCDRATAASFVGISLQALERAIAADPALGRELDRAEASAEFAHVRCIRQAAQDPTNWRASAWWLERMRPHLYAKRDLKMLTKTDLKDRE